MTEVEKMRSSRLADMAVPEIQERFAHAKALLARMGGMSTYCLLYTSLSEDLRNHYLLVYLETVVWNLFIEIKSPGK